MAAETTTQKEIREFTIAMDLGEAPIGTYSSDHLIRTALLLSSKYKAPGVARKLGLTARTINRYQTAQSAPTLRRAVQILNLLGYELVVRRKDDE